MRAAWGERQRELQAAAWNPSSECVDMKGWVRRPYVMYKGKNIPAARAVWIERHGPIPEGMWVLHRCNRGDQGCIGIECLYLGDHADNVQDMVAAGSARGVSARHLTPELAAEIKSQFTGKKGEVTRLAQKYNVPFDTVWNLKRGASWSWI